MSARRSGTPTIKCIFHNVQCRGSLLVRPSRTAFCAAHAIRGQQRAQLRRHQSTDAGRRVAPPQTAQNYPSGLHQCTSGPARRASTRSGSARYYEAVVVGAGPAGITVVGNLLEQHVKPILWIDDAFNGGRINRCYREVPSNTKVGLFVDFATAVAPFRAIVSNSPSKAEPNEHKTSNGEALDRPRDDKLAALRSLPQDQGCRLGYAADMCLLLTEGLKNTAGVDTEQARVSEAVLDEMTSSWRVRIAEADESSGPSQEVHAARLILCTGSSPDNSSLPVNIPGIQALDLDCALSPTTLAKTLSALGPTTIAVVGASHSAILVLMNLYNLASSEKPDLRIKWFTRHALRYAEYMDGWILRDNTGLKGEAAAWAKANLEPDTLPTSDVSRYITPIRYDTGEEQAVFKQYMHGCDLYIQAIGYSRQPTPDLWTSNGTAIRPDFDHETGAFTYSAPGGGSGEAQSRLPGMFGAGIAWPERVKDPLGNVEYAVGFFKFMKFVKRVIPQWVSN